MGNPGGEGNNWTWVLESTCPDCGNDVRVHERDALGPHFRAVGGAWRQMLSRGDVVTRAPTDPSRTWTIVEYGCHVRDVLELLEARVRTMLKKRKPPSFAMWDPDIAAAEGNYPEAEAGQVAWDLATNAGKAADLLDRINGEEWEKTCLRSDGKTFTVDTLTRYLLHDIEHHLWDAHQILGE